MKFPCILYRHQTNTRKPEECEDSPSGRKDIHREKTGNETSETGSGLSYSDDKQAQAGST